MIEITAIPAFNDNYIWCAHSTTTHNAIVIDPGSSTEVRSFLDENSLNLQAILITHHHPDHTAGVKDLKSVTGAIVYGSVNSKLDIFDTQVSNGQYIDFESLRFQVLDVPGHTLDHIAYYADQISGTSHPLLFCGDTLFSGGCGRLFEGTPEQMFNSLEIISKLPENTRVYPAHEYTLANLDFALHISPGNENILNYKSACEDLRKNSRETLPTTLKKEKLINPFLRSNDPTLIKELKKLYPETETKPVDVFTQLRKAKDTY